jgi:hypothetical protein
LQLLRSWRKNWRQRILSPLTTLRRERFAMPRWRQAGARFGGKLGAVLPMQAQYLSISNATRKRRNSILNVQLQCNCHVGTIP